MSLSRLMSLPRLALFALLLVLAGVAAPAARAQDNTDKWTLKPLVPPVFPLPRNSELNASTLGGTPTPYTTATSPLQNSSPHSQSVPGLKLSLPTRQDE